MFTKRINDNLDFDFDFTNWLSTRADTIQTFTVTAPGLTKGSVTQSAGVVKVFLAGGTRGSKYPLICKIVTTGGRTKEVSTSLTITN